MTTAAPRVAAALLSSMANATQLADEALAAEAAATRALLHERRRCLLNRENIVAIGSTRAPQAAAALRWHAVAHSLGEAVRDLVDGDKGRVARAVVYARRRLEGFARRLVDLQRQLRSLRSDMRGAGAGRCACTVEVERCRGVPFGALELVPVARGFHQKIDNWAARGAIVGGGMRQSVLAQLRGLLALLNQEGSSVFPCSPQQCEEETVAEMLTRFVDVVPTGVGFERDYERRYSQLRVVMERWRVHRQSCRSPGAADAAVCSPSCPLEEDRRVVDALREGLARSAVQWEARPRRRVYIADEQ